MGGGRERLWQSERESKRVRVEGIIGELKRVTLRVSERGIGRIKRERILCVCV